MVVITTAQLHSTKPELWFCAGSKPARDVSEIRDGEDLWQWSRLEIRLIVLRCSTIPQKQFIIIIAMLIKWKGISSHSWKLSSYHSFVQEHWRLAIFVFIPTFLRPLAANKLHRVLCIIFGVDWFGRKLFCIFLTSLIICFGTTDVIHKWNMSDKANVLKTIIFPSKVKSLMSHILATFWMFYIGVKKFFSRLSLFLFEIEFRKYWWYLLLS